MRIAALLIVLLAAMASRPIRETLPHYFLYRQDLPVIVLLLVTLLGLALMPVRGGRTVAAPSSRLTAWTAGGAAAALIAVGLAGHYLVLCGYAFSRDEQMALFDAEIFAGGHFAASLPDLWRPYHSALNVFFIPESAVGTGWFSIYRPVNAALHALVGFVADPAWASPLLTAAGLLATWRVARRVLPGDNESQLVAILLYATSTQVLATAMTSYAMAGHLAFNMIWLALLLHDRWYSHAAAIGVGFLAIGLHQPAYHPMFAGPFLFFCLVMRRRWGLSGIYALAYAAGVVAWGKYTALPLGELGVSGKPQDVDSFLLTRLWWAISEISPAYLWTQAANLVRLAAWQNLLLVPLLLAGLGPALRSRDPVLLGAVAALAVLVIFKLVLRPYQGHGWGFRYMHGLVGVACLIAALGWRDLRTKLALDRRHLAAATGATLFIAMPWLLWQAHHFSGLFAEVDRSIAATNSDLVIVDDTAPEFTADLVYNPPYLDRRPIRLLASRIEGGELARLCSDRTIAFVDAERLAPITDELGRPEVPAGGLVPDLARAAAKAGCTVVPLAPSP
ncbi:hypothetical protein ACWPM1_12000 [Tsuneonella sp. HG249]